MNDSFRASAPADFTRSTRYLTEMTEEKKFKNFKKVNKSSIKKFNKSSIKKLINELSANSAAYRVAKLSKPFKPS